jgi:transmembrane sensor
MTPERKLAQYVEHPLTESDLRRQWSKIEGRLEAPPRRHFAPVLALAALVGAVAIVAAFTVVALRRPPTPSAWDGAVLDSSADEVSVALADGSRIDLEPVSRVIVRESTVRAVRLDLHKGSARFDVPHVEGRTFDVLAGGVHIHVVGTRFSVGVASAASGQRVTVSVQQGVIEAESGGETTRVRAGETWSTVPKAEAAPAEPSGAPVAAPAVDSATSAILPHDPAAAPGTPVTPAPVVITSRPQVVEPSAQDLFEKANVARQSGDAAGAANAYAELLRHYPADSRAGLSAFELGRLKMDQLGDLRGAIASLQRAVSSAPGSGFREDALARLVRAHDTMGDVERCEKARKAYLTSYPGGVHAGAIDKACGHAH